MITQSLPTITIPVTPLFKPSTHASQPIRVLVIDDEEPLRRLLRFKLQGVGYQVAEAEDGLAGLQVFNDHRFDVILVDVMMPDMDGHAFCREIRKLSDIPMILISAMNRLEAVLEGFAAGADDYISKPFQLREIDLRISTLLRYSARCQTVPALQVA